MFETLLFLIGLVGLIGGNLTTSKNSPLKGRRARIVGLILMLPLLLLTGIMILVGELIRVQAISPMVEAPVLRWLDFVPAALGILGCFLYLHFSNPGRNPETLRFWLAAIVPAIGLYVAINLLPVPATLQPGLTDLVIGIVIPILFVLVVNLIKPLALNRGSAILFTVPVFVVHVYYFVFSDWISPGISSIINPGDTPGAGYQEIINGLLTSLASLFLWFSAALVSWITAKTRTTTWRTTE